MKTTISQNNVNFGFNYKTHEKIAQKVLDEGFQKLRKYSETIEKFVMAPDFDELGFEANTHFYYPGNNFLKPRSSFMDFDGRHNARYKYNQHCHNLYMAMYKGESQVMAEEIGRAKHFLDDMSVGLHVERGNVLKKWRDLDMHRDFEMFIRNNDDYFIKNSSKSNVIFRDGDFDDIFMSVADKAAIGEMPTKHNVNKWPEIAQKSINSAIDASKVFFKRVLFFLQYFPQK